MANMNGYIKLWRSLTEWEWYEDVNTTRLFIHLLLTVNYRPGKWQGEEIDRGQRVTSIRKLADETGLSMQQIRTSLKRLISTHDITQRSTSKYTVITVENYSKWQSLDQDVNTQDNTQPNNQLTNKQQATNKQLTTIEEEKELKKKKKEKKEEIYIRVFGEYTENENLCKTLMDFVKYREEKKSPLTERAIKLLLDKLNQLADTDSDKIAILEQSIMNGWKGVFELKGGAKPKDDNLIGKYGGTVL